MLEAARATRVSGRHYPFCRRIKEGFPTSKAFSLALKAFSLALLVGGVVLVIFGVSALQSLASGISVFSFFTGLPPTGKAIWMLVGGGLLFIVGLVGLLRGPKATK